MTGNGAQSIWVLVLPKIGRGLEKSTNDAEAQGH